MPMIDSDMLKPASDTAQAARQNWYEAGRVLATLRERAPINPHEILLAEEQVELTRLRFEIEGRQLAELVRVLIERGEREEREGL